MESEIPGGIAHKIYSIVRNFYGHVLFCSGFYNIKIVKVQDDYSEFLGPNYVPPEVFSTVVANHSTPIDHVLLGYFSK